MKPSELAQLRAKRTRTSNSAKGSICWMLCAEAKYGLRGQLIEPGELPSWWPFWSDVLKSNVRDAVRAARDVAKAEGVEL